MKPAKSQNDNVTADLLGWDAVTVLILCFIPIWEKVISDT